MVSSNRVIPLKYALFIFSETRKSDSLCLDTLLPMFDELLVMRYGVSTTSTYRMGVHVGFGCVEDQNEYKSGLGGVKNKCHLGHP